MNRLTWGPLLLTKDEQRFRAASRVLASAHLELTLFHLIRASLAGDLKAVADFQQTIQYAPIEMRRRILDRIGTTTS